MRGEAGIAVVQHELHPHPGISQVPEQVPGLLHHPGLGRVPRGAPHRHDMGDNQEDQLQAHKPGSLHARQARACPPGTVREARPTASRRVSTQVAHVSAPSGPVASSTQQADGRQGVAAFLGKRAPDWKMSKNADFPHELFDS
jgi:hypothetical protein